VRSKYQFMRKIIFATNNNHKLTELRDSLKGHNIVLSLKDIGFEGEIPEDFETLEENAHQKAGFIFDKFTLNCFADDTGLEIESLNGEPGVYSARYAGDSCSFEDNMNKVLKKMEGIKNRKAVFRTVISLIWNGEKYIFNGEVKGDILDKKAGKEGFGYDPIFRPEGYSISFAEMSLEEKNKISHRGKAAKQLVAFLKNIKQ